MKRSDLDVLINQKTGSAFHVIALNPNFRVGFRLFLEATDGMQLSLSFRVRVEKGELWNSEFPSLKMDLANRFPNASWSKVSTTYGSILGNFLFGCSSSDQVAVLESYKTNRVAFHIYTLLQTYLGEMGFKFDEAGFTELCDDYLHFLLENNSQLAIPLTADQVAFVLPNGFKVYQKGFEVTPVEMDNPMEEAVSDSPVDASIQSL